MQDQIAKVVDDVQAIMLRFPEFEEVSLEVVPVHYVLAGAGTVTAYEAEFCARVRDGRWHDANESADVWSMNQAVDWDDSTRALLRKMGLRSAPIVFGGDDVSADLIAQKLAERMGQKTGRAISSGL
jgi:hypothetical protein